MAPPVICICVFITIVIEFLTLTGSAYVMEMNCRRKCWLQKYSAPFKKSGRAMISYNSLFLYHFLDRITLVYIYVYTCEAEGLHFYVIMKPLRDQDKLNIVQ